MINLTENPGAIHNVQSADVVVIDGQQLLVAIQEDGRLFLTTTDSKGLIENKAHLHDYTEYFRHLRRSDVSNKAVMARSEIEEILRQGGYYIG